ncbi:MAG: protein arginine phosphatase [Chloroflexota bacterium]|jgi:protein-tyrosine phosphatase|nr:protein arginine phosphatase [Chloroflexota bacterium]
MAEGMLRRSLAPGLIEVRSAGVAAAEQISGNAVLAMTEIGIDISAHRPTQLNEEVVAWADVIIAMEERLASYVREQYPDVADEVHTLGRDIEDPVGGPLASYRACRDLLQTSLAEFTKQHLVDGAGALPPLGLDDALGQYQLDGSIDQAADREASQNRAADDVIGS